MVLFVSWNSTQMQHNFDIINTTKMNCLNMSFFFLNELFFSFPIAIYIVIIYIEQIILLPPMSYLTCPDYLLLRIKLAG